MNSNPLVSVVVPTRNSSRFIDACLRSIQAQTYTPIEIVVVDNNSTDDTKKIAERYASKVLNRGPERSAQVNYGVENARGEYVYKVDSDFVLEPTVVSECVTRAKEGFDAVVVHNSPDVRIGWIARIRKFEVDMYKYDITHSSARFVRREVFREIDGFDSAITAGEDYDFQNKLNRAGYRTGFIEAEALHLGSPRTSGLT
jgi:glycosyltransferase involved in cell wall biosynthesis